MFAFEVEYLLGRVFAGNFGDRTSSEWPPHPGRLFSALATAYFENGEKPAERAALEWLESQAPPHIRAGEAGKSEPTQVFVPTNYPGALPPVLRGKQPRYFPAQGPSEASVYFIWPSASATNETGAALDELAGRTAYLGKSCSVVRMRAVDTAPEANYEPDGGGAYVLRVPSQGRLSELQQLFAADRQASAGAQQLYRRTDRTESTQEATASEFGQMTVFRKASGPGLPIEATLTLTDAVRQALMSNAGESGPLVDLVHGHNGDTHCAIVSLPFVGSQHADGHVMGFAVVLPRRAAIGDRRSVLFACAELAKNGLHIPGIGEWGLEAVDATTVNQGLRPGTWTRPSLEWETVTPILLDRFPKKRGATVEEILGGSCRRIGLPEPESVMHGPYSKVPGVPSVPEFRIRRKSSERPRWGVHARIRFPVPVRGPVLVGAGRYFGLGMMRPAAMQRNNDQA